MVSNRDTICAIFFVSCVFYTILDIPNLNIHDKTDIMWEMSDYYIKADIKKKLPHCIHTLSDPHIYMHNCIKWFGEFVWCFFIYLKVGEKVCLKIASFTDFISFGF